MGAVTDRQVKRNIRLTVFAALAFALLVIGGLMHKLSSPRILNEHELRAYGAVMLPEPRSLGDIALIDHRGRAVTAAEFRGKWSVVFFGFSHCGDICPTTMATLAKMYAELKGDEKADLQVVLATVDPQRDSPAVLASYVSGFNADFLGVTGDPDKIAKFANDLAMAYSPVAGEGSDYQVAHSGNLVLINPKGELHGFLRPPHEHGSLRVVWRSLRETFGS
ncbi:MAG: SCO family protein [Porticoccaceae bacterium]